MSIKLLKRHVPSSLRPRYLPVGQTERVCCLIARSHPASSVSMTGDNGRSNLNSVGVLLFTPLHTREIKPAQSVQRSLLLLLLLCSPTSWCFCFVCFFSQSGPFFLAPSCALQSNRVGHARFGHDLSLAHRLSEETDQPI